MVWLVSISPAGLLGVAPAELRLKELVALVILASRFIAG